VQPAAQQRPFPRPSYWALPYAVLPARMPPPADSLPARADGRPGSFRLEFLALEMRRVGRGLSPMPLHISGAISFPVTFLFPADPDRRIGYVPLDRLCKDDREFLCVYELRFDLSLLCASAVCWVPFSYNTCALVCRASQSSAAGTTRQQGPFLATTSRIKLSCAHLAIRLFDLTTNTSPAGRLLN
jgi:hypothetical protein